MAKENIIAFSQAHAEPEWLQVRRQTAFDKISDLKLPLIQRVKLDRWNFGNHDITESLDSSNVPDFTNLGENPKLIQVGTTTVFQQLSPDLANKGVIFTDFYSALEEIPEIIEQYFIKIKDKITLFCL